jgi:hypothetical protein
MDATMTTGRRFSDKFKATVALEALPGDKTGQQIAASPNVVNPRRMSVTPAASHTRVLLGTGIMPSALAPNPQPMTTPSGLQQECGDRPTG